jgi:hypothetical protein
MGKAKPVPYAWGADPLLLTQPGLYIRQVQFKECTSNAVSKLCSRRDYLAK